MEIRRYQLGEEGAIWRVYFDATRESIARDYHPDLIERWAPLHQDKKTWAERLAQKNPFIAKLDGQIVGMAEIERNGFIDYFYVHPRWQCRGIGKALLATLESEAMKAGVKTILADVSVTARSFFLSQGFSIIEAKSNVIMGHPAPNFRMQKTLAIQSAATHQGQPVKPHQRIGSVSNAHVGADFERVALEFFAKKGIALSRKFPVEVGLSIKKIHCFDLGASEEKIIVECKSHKWTAGARVPSAKMTVWNEAMYYFHLAPADYRKILFVLHDRREVEGETLLAYYKRTYAHLIPDGVEFMEWDEATGDIVKV